MTAENLQNDDSSANAEAAGAKPVDTEKDLNDFFEE